MGVKPKLQGNQRVQFNADMAERDRLRHIMAENSHDVLMMELGVSLSAILRAEKGGKRDQRIPKAKQAEIKRRRHIYWMTREHYQARYCDRAMMAKYDVCKLTFLRYAQAYRQSQQIEIRRAA